MQLQVNPVDGDVDGRNGELAIALLYGMLHAKRSRVCATFIVTEIKGEEEEES